MCACLPVTVCVCVCVCVLVVVKLSDDGLVSAYYGGSFYSVCADHWTSSWSAGVCSQLAAGSVLSMSTVPLPTTSVYVTIVNGSVHNVTQLRLSTTCSSAAGVRLVCHQASCGLAGTTIQPFIVGGQIAAENAWPWAAALLYKGRYRCTASVIGNGWLLTAAHCFYNEFPSQSPLFHMPQYFAVRLGSVLSGGYTRQLRVTAVRRVVVHPGYTVDVKTNMRYNDLALVQLGDDLLTPATTSSNVSPLCLTDSARDSLNTLKIQQCYVIGWGLSNIDGNCEFQSYVHAVSSSSSSSSLTSSSSKVYAAFNEP